MDPLLPIQNSNLNTLNEKQNSLNNNNLLSNSIPNPNNQEILAMNNNFSNKNESLNQASHSFRKINNISSRPLSTDDHFSIFKAKKQENNIINEITSEYNFDNRLENEAPKFSEQRLFEVPNSITNKINNSNQDQDKGKITNFINTEKEEKERKQFAPTKNIQNLQNNTSHNYSGAKMVKTSSYESNKTEKSDKSEKNIRNFNYDMYNSKKSYNQITVYSSESNKNTFDSRENIFAQNIPFGSQQSSKSRGITNLETTVTYKKEREYDFEEKKIIVFTLTQFQNFMMPFINLNSITKEIKLAENKIENIYSFEIPKKERFLHKIRKRSSIKQDLPSKTTIIDTIVEFKRKLKQIGNLIMNF